VLNKLDILSEEDREQALQEARQLNAKCYIISAVTGEGVKVLLYDLYATVKKVQAAHHEDVFKDDIEAVE